MRTRDRVMGAAVLYAAAIALAACQTSGPTLPTAAATVVCPPLKSYSLAQEQAMAQALAALAPDNPLVGSMTDYGQLRAAVRACKATP